MAKLNWERANLYKKGVQVDWWLGRKQTKKKSKAAKNKTVKQKVKSNTVNQKAVRGHTKPFKRKNLSAGLITSKERWEQIKATRLR